MRVGLIARADKTGIAVQTWNFWKNMKPAATLIVDMSRFGLPCEPHRYEGDVNATVWQAVHYPDGMNEPENLIEEFLHKVDVVFAVETFYSYWLIKRARELGKRTVLQPNYEFLEYLIRTDIAKPDVFALPTHWHLQKVRTALPAEDVRVLPVPVDTDLLPWKQRESLNTILHTAGTSAQPDRNGTLVLIEAMKHVRSSVRCHLRSMVDPQVELPSNVDLDLSPVQNFWEMYDGEDLYVIPRRFGGLCLPMQEALAVGMPVIMTAALPQSDLLPRWMLIEYEGYEELRTRALIRMYNVDPVKLAVRIDHLHEHPSEMTAMSTWTREWCEANSWHNLRPEYLKVLTG